MSDHLLQRREFLEGMGLASVATLAAVAASPAAPPPAPAPAPAPAKAYQPISDRRIRVGIIGYGYCRFGADFGFQNHPNAEVVAVSDLEPDRREGLMKACRCDKAYESLELLVQDPKIEAVWIATDAPNHARHSIEALQHGKHVMCAVPAVWGSLEDADRLLETVRKTGLKYMMAETSCFRPDCYAMRQIFQAGGFGRLVYSEGEYYHYAPTPIPSYKGWRIGLPPLWYPTHSTAYYVGVTGGRFTSVSCQGTPCALPAYQAGGNRYDNRFAQEIALFRTSEGGTSRMLKSGIVYNLVEETGRVFGERGWMAGTKYQGQMKQLPDLTKPPLPPGVPAGGHGGSHGYLTHDFLSAIIQDREPLVNIYEALAMTVPGIVAHQSALKDGETLKVPQYAQPKVG